MELTVKISWLELVKQLFYKPNSSYGREYICLICRQIEYSQETIIAHINNHKIGDIC